jgi:hypothetical protein
MAFTQGSAWIGAEMAGQCLAYQGPARVVQVMPSSARGRALSRAW